jgi:major membrane immunogen (membrane-anchored lipoprotein)|tara:strand:+ start:737 stop:919 length:183 start_codon:yes stop_codon:yes gene_type:complete
MNNETFVWSEGLLQIIKKGVEHEKSKYSDWDDNKDKIKVEINFKDDKVMVLFTKIRKDKK